MLELVQLHLSGNDLDQATMDALIAKYGFKIVDVAPPVQNPAA